ncbi:MAG: Ku protein [Desulfobulbaceae bacterium]|nr:Ku protein [Desulfobulbaceae bacterium]
MTARAIWKGVIRLGESSIPVKLYSAVEEKRVHFRLLHEKDKTPVKQEKIHPETGEVVPSEAIRHGYETEDGRMVILAEQELKKLEPEPSRDIEIFQFLPGAGIDHRWYERPYFLGPDGDRESYFAMIDALGSNEIEGLARWVMRNKQYFGVLRLEQRYPILITLRHTEEVVSLADLKLPAGREIDRKELAMAEQLVSAMADTFDPVQYRDVYRDRVMALIDAKAGGKIVPLRKPLAKPPEAEGEGAEIIDLMEIIKNRFGSGKKRVA